MTRMLHRYTRQFIIDRGWTPGTDLEDRVMFALSFCNWQPGSRDERTSIRQQYPLLGYRLDFAWPKVRVCLEADGWHHMNPDTLAKDRRRDAELRAAGWWTFRVDHTATDEELTDQVGRVSRLVRTMLADRTWWHA